MMTIVFISYMVITIAIALYGAIKTKTNTDYVLGGKKLSGFSLALSERSTGESAWLLLGLTGEFFYFGYQIIWIALGCVLGIFFIWFFMSKRIRNLSEETGALTLTGLISKKFPGSEKIIGITSASVIIFFFLFYIAAQFTGAGKIVQDTFGLEPIWGNLVGSIIVILYCMIGGFIAVVLTDVFQAILMIITLIVLPIIALFFIISNSTTINVEAILSANEYYTSIYGNTQGWGTLLMILSGMSWALGYTGQPQLLTRMMAFRSEKDITMAKWVALFWTLFAYTGAAIIGITGFILAKSNFLGNETNFLFQNPHNAERILPVMIMFLVGPLMAGFLLSGALSAMMSTASSELILCSSSFTEDIIANFSKDKSKSRLNLNKITTLIFGIIALVLAFTMEDTVYGLVSYAWSGIGSSFGPALILLLFWKKFSRYGFFASLFFGTFSTIIWKTFFLTPTGISERLVSYVISFCMAILFSLIFPEKNSNNIKT